MMGQNNKGYNLKIRYFLSMHTLEKGFEDFKEKYPEIGIVENKNADIVF
ncbi:MAG: hypothetical protein PHY75_01780 [Bacteroidales bacterium]|nr:hypothetical protein [Bacteroidales bacterium]